MHDSPTSFDLHIQLSIAKIDHLRWVDRFMAFAEKGAGAWAVSESRPENRCQLGAWLDTAITRAEDMAHFERILTLHEELHSEASMYLSVMSLHHIAEFHLEKMHRASDALIKEIDRWQAELEGTDLFIGSSSLVFLR